MDLAALTRNLELLSDALGVDQPLVDLRASAYGHGLVEIARAAEAAGITAFRVSSLAEALDLRAEGIAADIWSPLREGEAQRAREADIRILDDAAEAPDDAARRDLGAGVYGLASPAGIRTTAVMTLTAEVIAVKTVTAGTGVSYGYTYRAPADTSIALVSIGYADGVPRLGSNTASARLAGATYPVVGRIAMDQLVLDIGAAHAEPGDLATVFGDASLGAPTAVEWGLRTRRPPLALTAGLGPRIVRTYAQ
ncbi:alanine racemase [Conyzicola nivalis]|uniref:alanine racemase n=1 Tax=Conyzicola nivalis TaxID=1477021 RepID=UPI00227B7CD6|nr:alanine racemase C-terminal domain-containing protein [Conyzicola nivalis]